MKSIKLRKTPSQKPEDKPIASNTVTINGRRNLFIVALIVFFMLVVGTYYVIKFTDLTNHSKDEAVCKSDLQYKIAKHLLPEKKDDLKPKVDEIKSLSGYEKDVACVYPIAIYNLNTGDLSAAEESYAKLVELYNPEVGFPPVYRYRANTPEEIRAEIDRMKISIDEIKNNAMYFD